MQIYIAQTYLYTQILTLAADRRRNGVLAGLAHAAACSVLRL